MSEEFGPDFYTLSDEDGKEFVLELLDSVEHNGILYHAFFPTAEENEETGEPIDIDADEEEGGIILLKVIMENGEEILSSLDSDEEMEEVYEIFMDRLYEEEE